MPTASATTDRMPAVHKLSKSLKLLIRAPHARGSPIPSPSPARTKSLFDALSSSAHSRGLDHKTWLTLSTAALVTLNSPDTLGDLYSYAISNLSESEKLQGSVERAGLMREAGLKCISFSGIPRTINNLGVLRARLSPEVAALLPTTETRHHDSTIDSRALSLWRSIYEPFASKLLVKLSASHPDLPVHILSSHYGALLSDPPSVPISSPYRIGRVLTSVVAISCLRAQEGVSLQVSSHVFGLRNSLDEGSDGVQGEEFLTSNEGCQWVLEEVDRIVQVLTSGRGSFAGGGFSNDSKL